MKRLVKLRGAAPNRASGSRASHGSAFVSYSLRFPGNAADLSVKTVYTNRPECQYLLPEALHARPEFSDGKSAATLIPPACGMGGINLHTWTGRGSIRYWSAFVAVLAMHDHAAIFVFAGRLPGIRGDDIPVNYFTQGFFRNAQGGKGLDGHRQGGNRENLV